MNSSQQLQDKFPSTCALYRTVGGKPDNYSDAAYAIFAMMIIIHSATFPFTIVLNLLVMIAVKTRVRLQSMSNILLACLASTDVMVGLVVQPLRTVLVVILIKEETTAGACLIHVLAAVFSISLCIASVVHLLLMTVDRYIAIRRPYTYHQIVTKSRIVIASCLAWILIVAKQMLWLTDRGSFLAINNVVLVFLIAVIAICNFILYVEVRRHEQQIAAQQVSVEARKNFFKQKRAFKLTMTVVSLLIVSYLPILLLRIVKEPLKNIVSLGTMCALFLVPGFLATLNSFMNPFIYCIRSRQFRIAFIELLMGKNYSEAKEFEQKIFGANAVANEASQLQSKGMRNTTVMQEGAGLKLDVNQIDTITDFDTNQGGDRDIDTTRKGRQRNNDIKKANDSIDLETTQGGDRDCSCTDRH